MDRFVLSIPENMKDALRIKAFQNRTSIAEEIRKAIDEYLRKDESLARTVQTTSTNRRSG